MLLTVLILLNYRNCNSQSIVKVNPSDTVVIVDTSVVMDIVTYRKIKFTGITTNDLIAQKTAFIDVLESQIQAYKEKVSLLDSSNKILVNENIRKDLSIATLVSSNNKYITETDQSLTIIEETINKEFNKPVYSDPKFYMGAGVGIILALIFIR